MSRLLLGENSMMRKMEHRYEGGRSTVRAPRSSRPVSYSGVESVIQASMWLSTPGRGLRLWPAVSYGEHDGLSVVVVAGDYSANVQCLGVFALSEPPVLSCVPC